MKKILIAAMMSLATLGAAAPALAWSNADVDACNSGAPGAREAAGCSDIGANTGTALGIVKGVLNVVIGIVGVIAVIIIVVAGIQMATSQGDAGKVAKARNAILYAVIGLVVAILSFAIVNFVLSAVFNS